MWAKGICLKPAAMSVFAAFESLKLFPNEKLKKRKKDTPESNNFS